MEQSQACLRFGPLKKTIEQRELFTACLWVQEHRDLVLLPRGKKSSKLACALATPTTLLWILHGNRGAVEGYLAITQRKDCVAESS